LALPAAEAANFCSLSRRISFWRIDSPGGHMAGGAGLRGRELVDTVWRFHLRTSLR
jgi:hypothetical protein